MAQLVIDDNLGHAVAPASEEELVAQLRRLDAEYRAEGEPRVVIIHGDPADVAAPVLYVGLGGDEASLAYDEGLTSSLSRGRHRDDHTEIAYRYADEYAEFFGWSRIPREDAISGAREFFRTGRRPTTVDWVDR